MAITCDYYGINLTKARDPKGSNIANRGIWQGNVKVQVENFVTSAVTGGAKTIAVAELNKGDVLIDVIITIESGAMASSGTLTASIYDGTTTNAITGALDANAGVANSRLTVYAQRGSLTADSVIMLTASAHDIVVSKKVQVITLYSVA